MVRPGVEEHGSNMAARFSDVTNHLAFPWVMHCKVRVVLLA